MWYWWLYLMYAESLTIVPKGTLCASCQVHFQNHNRIGRLSTRRTNPVILVSHRRFSYILIECVLVCWASSHRTNGLCVFCAYIFRIFRTRHWAVTSAGPTKAAELSLAANLKKVETVEFKAERRQGVSQHATHCWRLVWHFQLISSFEISNGKTDSFPCAHSFVKRCIQRDSQAKDILFEKRTVINDISAAIVKCRRLEFGTPPMLVGCRRVKFTWTSFNADWYIAARSFHFRFRASFVRRPTGDAWSVFFVYAPVFGSDEGAFGSCSAAVRRRRQQRQRHWCCRVLVSVLPSFPRTNKRRSRLLLSEAPSLRIGAADARVTSSDRLTKLWLQHTV